MGQIFHVHTFCSCTNVHTSCELFDERWGESAAHVYHLVVYILGGCRFFNDPSSSYVRKANELSKRASNLLKAAKLPESDFRMQLLALQVGGTRET